MKLNNYTAGKEEDIYTLNQVNFLKSNYLKIYIIYQFFPTVSQRDTFSVSK